jgi:hypothetical protein
MGSLDFLENAVIGRPRAPRLVVCSLASTTLVTFCRMWPDSRYGIFTAVSYCCSTLNASCESAAASIEVTYKQIELNKTWRKGLHLCQLIVE